MLNGVPTLCQDVILLPEGASNLKMSDSCKKPKEVCVCVCVGVGVWVCVCGCVCVGVVGDLGVCGVCVGGGLFLPS